MRRGTQSLSIEIVFEIEQSFSAQARSASSTRDATQATMPIDSRLASSQKIKHEAATEIRGTTSNATSRQPIRRQPRAPRTQQKPHSPIDSLTAGSRSIVPAYRASTGESATAEAPLTNA